MCYLLSFKIIYSDHFTKILQFLTFQDMNMTTIKRNYSTTENPNIVSSASHLLMGCVWDLIQWDHQIIQCLLLFFHIFQDRIAFLLGKIWEKYLKRTSAWKSHPHLLPAAVLVHQGQLSPSHATHPNLTWQSIVVFDCPGIVNALEILQLLQVNQLFCV